MSRSVAAAVAKVTAALVGISAVMAALGWLLTRPLRDNWPVDAEDTVVRELAQGRSRTLDNISYVLSELGNTATILALLMLSAGILRSRLGRWHEAGFVVLAVSIQAVVFMTVQALVERPRPDVLRLDSSLPTSSFPSGHTGAAVALYVSLALVVLWQVRDRLVRIAAIVVLTCVPFLVAYARMYRGMHHPTDVVASLLNGAAAVGTSAWATLVDRFRRGGPVEAERRAAQGRPTTAQLRHRLRADR